MLKLLSIHRQLADCHKARSLVKRCLDKQAVAAVVFRQVNLGIANYRHSFF